MRNRIKKNWKELLLVFVALAVSGVIHGYNMFGFPYYENDEGTYLSRAWSLITQGKLAPYTFWYDHAPAGWILMSLWVFLTKGVFTFGFSLNSGRVLMLLIHLASTLLIVKIAKKITGSTLVGVLSALSFSLSPLGLYFQRRVLLDNIMTFWTVWSYYFLLGANGKLSRFMLSAVLLGIAILTKENAIVFVPGFLYTLYCNAHVHHRRFAIAQWIIVLGSVISLYFLFALLKGELFPYDSPLGGTSPHVSLIGTMKYQLSRGGGSILDLENSTFWKHFRLWVQQDAFIMTAGIVSNMVLLLMCLSKNKRRYMGPCLLGILFWLFLIRGGLVIEFYILPMIPLLSLYIGLFLYELSSFVGKVIPKLSYRLLLAVFYVAIFGFYYRYSQVSRAFGQSNTGHFIFRSKQTQGQREAIEWIRNNLDPKTVVIIDNYGYLELHDPYNPSGKIYPNAHYYWTVDNDAEIKEGVLKNNPETIDFVAKTPQMQVDLVMGTSPSTSKALEHATFVKSFNTEGWGVEIWATSYPEKILRRSWESYKKRFLQDGRSIDLYRDNLTTSEGQSYALMRAVWMDDKETFSKVWVWTKKHLEEENHLFAWKWGEDTQGKWGVLDHGTATDADTDIALALLMAHKRWGGEAYLVDAQNVIQGIWDTEVKQIDDQYFIVPGNWAKEKDELLINPSYLAPYAYRIFAEVDMDHDWTSLVETSYELLEGCMSSDLGGTGTVYLPPTWCMMAKNGDFVQSTEDGLESTEYSYDALRTMWRLALDYEWYQEDRARKLLEQSSAFLLERWQLDKEILVGYTHDGLPWEKYESVLAYAANLANFSITAPDAAEQLYKTKVLEKFYENYEYPGRVSSYWEDRDSYYTQNWAWFGMALYTGNLPNLWKDR